MITGLLTLPLYAQKAGVTYANHCKAICESQHITPKCVLSA